MRHRVKVNKLNRSQGHYRATMANLAGALIEHKQIKTTLSKAKELRPYIEKLITHAEVDDVHKRRVVYKKLNNRQLVFELFTVIGPKNAEREGGYTRIMKLGKRRGDGTEMAVIQLVGFEAFDQPKAKAKAKKPKVKEEEKPLLELDSEKPEETSAETPEETKGSSEVAEPTVTEETEETVEAPKAETSDSEPAEAKEKAAEVKPDTEQKKKTKPKKAKAVPKAESSEKAPEAADESAKQDKESTEEK